ncbi:hypothetical protein [Actinacidiphila soli]|nr:hypothetical protein [Actinacidiphila soli]
MYERIRMVIDYRVRVGDLLQSATRISPRPAGLRPVRCRSDFGAGFLRSPSLDGGLEKLRKSDPTWPSNSAIRSICSAIIAACAETRSFSSLTNPASSSYEGCGG